MAAQMSGEKMHFRGGENADYFELLRTFVAIAPYKLYRLGNANKFALLSASVYICGFTN